MRDLSAETLVMRSALLLMLVLALCALWPPSAQARLRAAWRC